ncbi:MAG TPA: cadherin-like domain-containing protein, partial [Verrucomicrobiales bacterium]|nr:cadherin-like domain-containing protein [Verrucomicrobiales bacterium]
MKPDSSSFSLRRLPVLAATALLGIAGIARAATPTISSVSILNGNNEDTAFTITYAILAAAANEHDDDAGDDISFRVESVTNGTLRKNGVAVEPGVTLLSDTGASWSWTPPANDNGVIDAFTIKVTDGTNVSTTTAVQVRIQVDAVADPVQLSGSALADIDDNDG